MVIDPKTGIGLPSARGEITDFAASDMGSKGRAMAFVQAGKAIIFKFLAEAAESGEKFEAYLARMTGMTEEEIQPMGDDLQEKQRIIHSLNFFGPESPYMDLVKRAVQNPIHLVRNLPTIKDEIRVIEGILNSTVLEDGTFEDYVAGLTNRGAAIRDLAQRGYSPDEVSWIVHTHDLAQARFFENASREDIIAWAAGEGTARYDFRVPKQGFLREVLN